MYTQAPDWLMGIALGLTFLNALVWIVILS